MSHETAEPDKNNLHQLMMFASRTVSRITLIIIFFGIFMPAGFIMRLLGHDPLHRKLESTANTYYCPSKKRSENHMDKPF